MKKIRLFILLAVTLFIAENAGAQVNFDFNSQEDLDMWKGAQCDLSLVDGSLQLAVTGDFWAVASYEPEEGITWDFDAYPICAVKIQKKYGDLFLKLKTDDGDYKLSAGISAGDGIKVLKCTNSDALIHIFMFEDYNADEATKDAFVGTRTFGNLQLANEYVDKGNNIQFDWIKSFTDAESALEYIIPIVEGGSVDGIFNETIVISGGNGCINVSGMTDAAKVEVFSISGQAVKTETIMNGSIDNLSKGIYIVRTGGKSKLVGVN